MTIDWFSVPLDLFNNVGEGSRPFRGYGGAECGKIDGPYGLGAEHKRIIPQTLPVDLGFENEVA
jgi:hypothetical protein